MCADLVEDAMVADTTVSTSASQYSVIQCRSNDNELHFVHHGRRFDLARLGRRY